MRPEDEAWVAALFAENAAKMYEIAVRRLDDPEMGEDIVQEAFLALVSKLEAVKDHPNPAGWLMKALKYLILQTAQAKQKQMECEQPLSAQIPAGTGAGYRIPLSEMLPPGLTPREKKLLILRYEDQLSYEEIAKQLHIPVTTCRPQFFRARKHYRACAEKEKIFLELM